MLSLLEQRKTFLDLLHGNGSDFIDIFRKSASSQSWKHELHLISDINTDNIGNDLNQNYYVSIQQFADDSSHEADNCILSMGLFVDIDILHEVKPYDYAKADELILSVLKRIDKFTDEKKILPPTMVVSTGRGLALYYLFSTPLDLTVNGNGNFRDNMAQSVLRLFSELMDTAEISVDQGVHDAPRVCRIPGTYNTAARRYATLLRYDDTNRYTPQQLIDGLHLHIAVDHQHSSGEQGSLFLANHYYNTARFRYDAFKKLATLRNYIDGTGRELLAFIAYAHLKQFCNPEEAVAEIIKFNGLYKEPLNEAELFTLIKGVDNHIGRGDFSGINGTYKFRTDTLIQLLAITTEELTSIGLNKYKLIRESRAENHKAQLERDILVCTLYLCGQTAKAVVRSLPPAYQCSEKTVWRILKRNHIDRSRSVAIEDLQCEKHIPYSSRSESDKKWSTCTKSGGKASSTPATAPVPASSPDPAPNQQQFTAIGHTLASGLQQLSSGENAFVTGLGGTGKTLLLQQYIDYAVSINKNVLVTSTSNSSAVRLRGVTTHTAFHLYPCIPGNNTIQVLSEYDIIIIDEISIFGAQIFSTVAKMVLAAERLGRKKIQLIVAGDFGQLGPFFNGFKEEYAFKAQAWHDLGLDKNIICLTQPIRQAEDPEYAHNLFLSRYSCCECIPYFNSTVDPDAYYSEAAIHLCALNKDVNDVNNTCIQNHVNDPSYKVLHIPFQMPEYITESKWLEQEFPVFIGMPVITMANTDTYCKGELGYIVRIYKKSVIVRLTDRDVKVTLKVHIDRRGDTIQFHLNLAPAFAITFHKAQGLTLEAAIIHPHCYEDNQLYVGLSRLISLKGLTLTEPITPEYLRCNYEAANYGMVQQSAA